MKVSYTYIHRQPSCRIGRMYEGSNGVQPKPCHVSCLVGHETVEHLEYCTPHPPSTYVKTVEPLQNEHHALIPDKAHPRSDANFSASAPASILAARSLNDKVNWRPA